MYFSTFLYFVVLCKNCVHYSKEYISRHFSSTSDSVSNLSIAPITLSAHCDFEVCNNALPNKLSKHYLLLCFLPLSTKPEASKLKATAFSLQRYRHSLEELLSLSWLLCHTVIIHNSVVNSKARSFQEPPINCN